MKKTLIDAINNLGFSGVLSVSPQQATAILARQGLTMSDARRHSFCNGHIEILLSWGGKLKYDPFNKNWYIRSYGCTIK